MWLRAAVVGALLLAGGSATAQDVIDNPDWVKRPTPEDMLAVWPQAALREGESGLATIECEVTVQGTLRGCGIVSERPKDLGFGPAALALTPQFVMKPMLKNGKPAAGAHVRIPVRFIGGGIQAGSRIANPPAIGRKVVNNLPWAQAPSYAEVAAAFPAEARAKKTAGAATLDCLVDKAGALSGCGIAQETPRGLGFGPAARSLAGRFKAASETLPAVVGVHTQILFAFPVEMAGEAPPVIGKPDWGRLPTVEDVAASYPAGVDKKAFAGRATLSCQVAADGALVDCKVAREEPAGLGLGEAALRLSRQFAVRLWTPEGLPTIGGKVSVPIRYAPEN